MRSIATTNKTQQVSNWSWVWSFVNIPKFTCVWCALNLILQVNIILWACFMCNLISLCTGGWTYYSCTIHTTSCYFGFVIFLTLSICVMLMSLFVRVFSKTCLSPNGIAKFIVVVIIKLCFWPKLIFQSRFLFLWFSLFPSKGILEYLHQLHQ